MRFKLPEAAFRKLCRLVKQRDEELAETYQSIIGEWPPSRDVFTKNKNGRSTDIYLLWDNVRKSSIGWLIEETPDKERLIPQKEMPVFFMDENNTYTSSSGRKFKIIKNPRGHWIVQNGDRKERVSIEWQL